MNMVALPILLRVVLFGGCGFLLVILQFLITILTFKATGMSSSPEFSEHFTKHRYRLGFWYFVFPLAVSVVVGVLCYVTVAVDVFLYPAYEMRVIALGYMLILTLSATIVSRRSIYQMLQRINTDE
jgi:tellurite resistance protein TehA-like permease